MKTTSEDASAALFTIEKVSFVPSPISQLSGCALCEHCTLLRLMAQSRNHVGVGLVPAHGGQAQGAAPTDVLAGQAQGMAPRNVYLEEYQR